jgi:hypothetical protein
MTLRNIQQGEVVTVRIYKQYVGFSWANNYEVAATTNINDPAQSLAAMVDRLVALERLLHLQGVIIDRATVSSYAPDSQPYDPDTLTTFPYSLSGQRSAPGEVLPLELCLFVRRNVNFGRDGRLLYRGCLTENDMSAAAFRPLLTTQTVNNLQNAINNWFQQGISPGWVLVMASGTPQPTSIRRVVGLQVSEKIAVKKVNNRYFRRRP